MFTVYSIHTGGNDLNCDVERRRDVDFVTYLTRDWQATPAFFGKDCAASVALDPIRTFKRRRSLERPLLCRQQQADPAVLAALFLNLAKGHLANLTGSRNVCAAAGLQIDLIGTLPDPHQP